MGLDKKINSARDPQDLSKEDPDHYSETHVYSFQIDEVLKGEILHPSIQINKAYQIKMNDRNGNEFLVKEPYYYKPDPKKKYLLFLVKAPDNTYSAGFINYEISFDSTVIATLSKPDQNLKEQPVQVGDKTLSFHQEVAEAPDDITGKSFSDIKSEIVNHLKGS